MSEEILRFPIGRSAIFAGLPKDTTRKKFSGALYSNTILCTQRHDLFKQTRLI